MKILYYTTSHEIVLMGYFDSLTPGAGQAVADYNGNMPDSIAFYTFDGTTLTRKSQPVIDQITASTNFNVALMAGGLAQAFDIPTQISLASQFAAINGYASAKAFYGTLSLKSYLDGLVTAGVFTADQKNTVVAVVAQQGIDLNA